MSKNSPHLPEGDLTLQGYTANRPCKLNIPYKIALRFPTDVYGKTLLEPCAINQFPWNSIGEYQLAGPPLQNSEYFRKSETHLQGSVSPQNTFLTSENILLHEGKDAFIGNLVFY